MRRRLEKPVASDHLPDVAGPSALDERVSNGPAPPRGVTWGPTTASPAPKYLFTSPVAPARSLDTMRSLDLRDKKKLRCIWLAPDEGDQQIVRPPPLDSMQYAQISASMFGNNVMEKIKRADSLSVQLERSNRFMDAMHTYEQAAKMLLRCIQKREEASGVIMDELKWLRIDYEIRCVQLVALCMCGARKTATGGDNTAFLLLKKAEELTARDGLQYCKKHVQRAAVYQNVANYYKKQKKYQAALQAAEKAVRINDKLPPSDRFPIAYFLQACLHGLLQEPAKAGFMYTACLAVAESQRPANETPQTAEVFYTLKAATLHNLAIEWANLNMPDQTRDALASAMEVGVHYLAQTHPVVVRILETYKVMRENFLFHASNRSSTAPVAAPQTTRSSAPGRPTSPPLGNVNKRPLPPSLQKTPHDTPRDLCSPRTRRITTREAHYPESEDISPMPPTSRRPTTPMSASRVSSPRPRAVKRPTTTSEMPAKLSGQTLPPGATRTSHLRTVPDKIYSHSLGAKYNSHKERILEEARSFGVRRRAATKIQKLWERALLRLQVVKRKENAAILIQSILRMHHQKAQYDQTLRIVRRTQAVWRGGLTRTRKKMALASVVQIQSAWRCRNERAKYAIRKIRLVLLQSVVRGFLARTARTRKNKAAAGIQAQMRRHLCMKEFIKTLAAAAIINRVLRGMQARQRVENGVKCVVSGALKDLVEAVEADDMEVQVTKATVESTFKGLVAIVSIEPERDEQLEKSSDDLTPDVEGILDDKYQKVLNVVSVGSPNDREENTESFQIVGDGVKSAEDQDYEEDTPPIETPPTVECTTKFQTFPLLNSDSDRAILEAMMSSTISKFIDASIIAAINDCSNDIHFAVDLGSNSPSGEEEAIVEMVSTTDTTLEVLDTPVAVEDAVGTFASSEQGAVEAKHEDNTLVQDPVVEAAGTGMAAAEVSLERAASNINCSPSIPEAVAKVSIVPDTTTKPTTIPEIHLEAGPSTAKPAVDAEVSEVMAAVLSQVSIAPAKPVEVEPVVETAASERGESVAVDAVEVAAAVEAAISAAESTPAATETPGLQEMLTEAAMPAETVEEVAAAPAKEEPAVDAEVSEVMAAVLSQVSIAPAKPVEVEPVVETAASERGESVAVDAVEVAAKMACLT
ncbi:hypothetical protein PC116_g12239 [Phytophthora cactorum]|uniref:Uncharacterized protein n=1 Tax=Phytophthora cactorum TaxID=29920 RepID=A0A8T1KWN7_9STRA|nr:hypothetical protein PC118_g8531 [Phytophthora cactorum]KAG3038511.1 hypothetical protein PC119_g2845 [Phytophthora cactorum]KAG4239782.1 hypothetical protein PC116_g12239 [Phytophthora cactorum]